MYLSVAAGYGANPSSSLLSLRGDEEGGTNKGDKTNNITWNSLFLSGD